MQAVTLIEAPWREPLDALAGLADEPWTLAFISGQGQPWSYVMAGPDAVLECADDDPRDPFLTLTELAGETVPIDPSGPPFQGGVAGLAGYELGDRVERLGLPRSGSWPDLACARYPALLAFDHKRQRLFAVGRGREAASRALDWLARPAQPAAAPRADILADDPDADEAAVAQVVERIRAGEIFQANIARRWRGRLGSGARPFDLMARLTALSPAPFAAYLRLPGRAVVSNSPERFVSVTPDAEGFAARTQPIKGTAPRSRDPGQDRELAAALLTSPKDRAENLMIVDLMRNDLSRVCTPGQVKTPELFKVASFANVHHLVSTVTGRLAPGCAAADLFRAAFPPGSITGAPKVQAMKVIAQLEGARGPFFGSMFHLGLDGAFDSSVLIRTAAFVEDAEGWALEMRAGAGIVADSDPASERRETETKVAALLVALTSENAGVSVP